MARPDAVILPAAFKTGARVVHRLKSILKVAEPILEVDRAAGERAWIRRQPDLTLFVTRDVADSLLFRTGHDREGESRYKWTPQPDGSQIGVLVDGANDEE